MSCSCCELHPAATKAIGQGVTLKAKRGSRFYVIPGLMSIELIGTKKLGIETIESLPDWALGEETDWRLTIPGGIASGIVFRGKAKHTGTESAPGILTYYRFGITATTPLLPQ